MPQLLTIRKGWENENLAAYLLSRFSFVARPTSVADDVGSDFFCTIFEVEDVAGRDALMPRNSFAIQVKSSRAEVAVDNKLDYLIRLELPFFIGVATQSPPSLSIHSAELLPLLFSEFGRPDGLSLAPVETLDLSRDSYCERVGNTGIRLRCPLAVTLTVDDSPPALRTKVEVLLRICARAHANIATRVSEEHIYDVDGKGLFRIVAGSGSARFFRLNFLKRLGEVFYNLQWLYRSQPDNFPVAEFRAFETIHQTLERLYGPLPPYISDPYRDLSAKLGNGEQRL